MHSCSRLCACVCVCVAAKHFFASFGAANFTPTVFEMPPFSQLLCICCKTRVACARANSIECASPTQFAFDASHTNTFQANTIREQPNLSGATFKFESRRKGFKVATGAAVAAAESHSKFEAQKFEHKTKLHLAASNLRPLERFVRLLASNGSNGPACDAKVLLFVFDFSSKLYLQQRQRRRQQQFYCAT